MRSRRVFVLAGLICLLGITIIFIFGFLQKDSYVEGIVVAADNSQPLPGTLVTVSNRGWGFVDGQLVWDKDYLYQAVTDQNGKFRITFSVGSSAHVKVNRSGYLAYDGWHDRNSQITITLNPV